MAPGNRDDFNSQTKRDLAHRVGYLCSFRGCDVHTAGPSDESLDAVNNIGVAAHIAAAAPGGRRYDAGMTPTERGGIANGIWLCQTHAKQIDGDEATFTVALLREMKAEAEARAKARIGRTAVAQAVFKAEVSTCFYVKSYRAAYVPAVIVNEGASPVTIKKVELKIGNDRFAPNKPRENLALEGCEWFEPGPLRLEAADAKSGAWYFGWSFAGGGPYVEATPGAPVELLLSPVVGPDVLLQCGFRTIPITDSGACRSPIPDEADHRFRSKPIAERIARWEARGAEHRER